MSEVRSYGWLKTRLDKVIDQFIVPMRDKPLSWSGDTRGVVLKILMVNIYMDPSHTNA